MRRIAVTTAVVFLTLAVLAVAWQLRTIVLVFVISLVIGSTLDGPIERLIGSGFSRRYAILTTYVAATLFLLGLIALIALPIVSETNLLTIDITQGYNQLRFYISSLTGARIDFLATLLPTDEQFSEGVAVTTMNPMLRQAVGITQDVGAVVGQLLLAFVLSIYWTLDSTRFERLWLSLLAPEQRSRTRTILRRMNHTVGAYIRSELFQVVLTGGLLTLGFWIIGFKYPFTAATLAALAWLIPLLGGGLALIPVLLIGWFSDLNAMLLGAVYTVGVLLVMEFQVERRMFSGHRYWGVLVVFVMLALGSEFGLVGLLIAPPVAVAIQILLDAFLEVPTHKQAGKIDLDDLRRRLAAAEAQLAGRMPVQAGDPVTGERVSRGPLGSDPATHSPDSAQQPETEPESDVEPQPETEAEDSSDAEAVESPSTAGHRLRLENLAARLREILAESEQTSAPTATQPVPQSSEEGAGLQGTGGDVRSQGAVDQSSHAGTTEEGAVKTTQ